MSKIRILVIFCMLIPLTSAYSQEKNTKSVLLINSYHKGFPWTDNIVKGIESVLISESDNIELTVEYMNTKSIAYDAAYKKVLLDSYRFKFRNHNFDLIIVSDDNAFDFLREFGAELFPDIPIVFCGLNNSEAPNLVNPEIFTGIMETLSHEATIELILNLFPDTKKIMLIVDSTPSGNYRWSQIEPSLVNYKDIEFLRISDNLSISEIENILSQLTNDTAVIFFTLYRDKSGNYLSLKEGVTRITEASSRPVFTTHLLEFPYGVTGGKVLGGFYHGEHVAKIAMRILNGEEVGSISIIDESPAQYVFNYSQLKKWGIQLSNLPEKSIILNKPVSIYERNKSLVWGVLGVIIILITIIISLQVNSIKRKKAAEALKASEDKFRALFELSPVGMAMIDHETGDFLEVNNSILKAVGYAKDEFTALNFRDITPAEYKKQEAEQIEELNKTGHFGPYEKEYIRKDGSRYPIKIRGFLITNSNGRKVVWEIIEDLSERKQAEQEKQILQQQLNHKSKMDAIGQLAGGMAHDFNNVLSGILSASELLKLPKSGLMEKNLKYVDLITKSAVRASDLISKLLAFSRKGKIVSTSLDIHEILNDVVEILSGTIDKKITISVKKDALNHKIIGDFSEIESTFLNLGINAYHAMPDGGEIHFKTKNIYLDQKFCDSSSFEITAGEFLQIEIKDLGCGIPQENLDKIFEPFFTTKGLGKGTGLGLSAVYGTIQDHHGMIDVHSEVGSGTTFTIFLPCSEQQVEAVRETSPIVTGTGTILLVDDEEINRILNKDILESLGYRVLLAENGQESVDIFSKMHSEIDIVIMDMIMPKMNGSEAFYKLKELDSNCKIIITSGYTQDENIDELMQNGLSGFIYKPYKMLEISQLLNDVLIS